MEESRWRARVDGRERGDVPQAPGRAQDGASVPAAFLFGGVEAMGGQGKP